MNLFNHKTLARHLVDTPQIPEEHLKHLTQWSELISSKRIFSHKETALDGDFKSTIIEGVLGYTSPVGNETYTVSSEEAILRGSVDLALGHFSPDANEIIAPFELKGANTKDLDAIMSGRSKTPVQQAWEYATNVAGVKWVLVTNYLEIRLYGFGEGTQAYESFDLETLIHPQEYARFMLLLSAENLLGNRTQKLLEDSRKEDKDITDKLYGDYKTLRGDLIEAVRDSSPDMDGLDTIALAQKILDRVLFTAFAEDTGLLPDDILLQAYKHADPFTPKPIWDNFKGLFAAIDKGSKQLDVPPYNGGLFASDPQIDSLTIPNEVCEGFKKLGEYDFASEISVTVLGHIFEQSIADVERLQAIARGEEVEEKKASGTSGKRKRDGVVYTPDYIARFIVEHTLGTHLKEIFANLFSRYAPKSASLETYGQEEINWKPKKAELGLWEDYRDRLQTLRIVDPACGSGVFLVMAFDYMKEELTRVNDKIADLKGGVADLFDPDSEILTNNLFGVDVNSESVEITKLSLWVKTARKGKLLDSLDDNLKVGDSLLEDSNYTYLDHGFIWNKAFPKVFEEGGFDVVLGNPPYVQMALLTAMKPYLETRFEVYHGVADLYCYFFERGLRLLKEGGRLGFISSSTFFKTNFGKSLRVYLSDKATMENVVDFGGEQVFEGVTTYPAILTMKHQEALKGHQVSFWNIEELPKANFRASYEQQKQPYPQEDLGENSWEFSQQNEDHILRKIQDNKKTLIELYGRVYRGVVTGCNECFLIDNKTRQTLCNNSSTSEEIIYPILEGRDIGKWNHNKRELYLIFTRRGILIDNYPAIKEYLIQSKNRLEPKPIEWKPEKPNEKWPGRKKGAYSWYEIQDVVGYFNEFLKPKIIWGNLQSSPSFVFDNSNFAINAPACILPTDDLFLLALMNSNVSWYFWKNTAIARNGGYLELKPQYVEPLPIPPASDEQKQQLSDLAEACQKAAEARYKLQEDVRRRIPDLCPPEGDAKLSKKLKNWWEFADFSQFQKEIKKQFKTEIPLRERSEWEDWLREDRDKINRLSAEIKSNEDKINQVVYQMFDLTPEEVELLEANI